MRQIILTVPIIVLLGKDISFKIAFTEIVEVIGYCTCIFILITILLVITVLKDVTNPQNTVCATKRYIRRRFNDREVQRDL